MHDFESVAIALFVLATCSGVVWITRPIARGWDKAVLPPPEATVTLPPAGRSRHPRLELEFHHHRLLGVRLRRFARGAHAGWSLHLGCGFGCLCVDWYRRGRRP